MKRLGAITLLLAALLTACGGLRSDVAGDVGQAPTSQTMTELAPYPSDIKESGWEALLATIDSRVEQWETDVDPSSMTSQQIAESIEAIFAAIGDREAGPDDMLVLRELFGQVRVLCGYLPADHPFMGDYC